MRGGGEFGLAAAPAIVDADRHDRVVALLTDPARLRRPVREAPERTEKITARAPVSTC